MIPLLFLLGLLVLAYLIHRSGRRGRKLNEAIEANRDLRNDIKVQEIEAENDHLASKLTETDENQE